MKKHEIGKEKKKKNHTKLDKNTKRIDWPYNQFVKSR